MRSAGIAFSELDRADYVSVKDALDYLSRYGDEKVRKPILERYLRWARESSASPTKPASGEESRQQQSDPGSDLGAALLNAQGWLPTPDLISIVLDHCVGKEMCESFHQLTTPDLNITPWNSYGGSIGHLSMIPTQALFEAKLDQYPKGTAFRLEHITSANPETDRKREQQLRSLLLKHGMRQEN